MAPQTEELAESSCDDLGHGSHWGESGRACCTCANHSEIPFLSEPSSFTVVATKILPVRTLVVRLMSVDPQRFNISCCDFFV